MKPTELLGVLPEIVVADFWQKKGDSYVYRGMWNDKENKVPSSIFSAEIIEAKFKSPTRIAIYVKGV